MTTLQVLLAAIGVLVIGALALHGYVQARRADPRRPEPLPTLLVRDTAGPGMAVTAPVAASDEARQEPGLEGDEDLGAAQDPVTQPADEPTLGEGLTVGARRAAPRLDPRIDAIAQIALELPLDGTVALAHMPTTRRAGSKPFFIEACHVATGLWETPRPGERYTQLQAGVQITNRIGAINALEYSEFVQKTQAFADAIGAMVDFPDMADVLVRARELDAFAGEHDAQLTVRLMARQVAWSPGYIQQQAARLGFSAGAVPGRLVLPSVHEGAPPMLTLQFDASAAYAQDPAQAAVREVILSFDVPQTAPQEDPFKAWRDVAIALADEMEATIVDDAGQALQSASFDAIGAELQRVYDALETHELAAGSAVARRVFS